MTNADLFQVSSLRGISARVAKARPPKRQVIAKVESDLISKLVDDGYDKNAAYLLAIASAWAYSDEEALRLMMSKYGMNNPAVRGVGISCPALLIDVDAFVIAGDGVGILVFRGTEIGDAEFTDALTDANVGLIPSFGADGNVHAGFLGSVNAVWDYVHAAMEEVFGAAGPIASNGNGSAGKREGLTIERLYLTGHSLGGALAVLAADRIHKDDSYAAYREVLKGIYTFGQPAVGDSTFMTSCIETKLADRIYRHVYGRDWVPTLPPWTTGSFLHFGKLFVSSPQGWVRSNRRSFQAATAALSGLVAGAAFALNKFRIPRWLMELVNLRFSLEDHLPAHYIECSRTSASP